MLVAGAAAASLLGSDSLPAARAEMASSLVGGPVSNKQAKNDRLAVATVALASSEPAQTAVLTEPLRQAFASSTPADIEASKVAAPVATAPVAPPPKPKLVNKPAPQKSY